MKKIIHYLLRLMMLWLVLFAILRLFFVLYQWPLGKRIHLQSDLFRSFIEGYVLDLATATILTGLPLLLAIAFYITGRTTLLHWMRRITGIVLILYVAVAVADAGLYREWNAKINMQALAHFKHPAEVFHTLSIPLLLLFLVLLSLFSWPFWKLYQRWIHPVLPEPVPFHYRRLLRGFIFLILSVGISIIIIRGGITNIPINQSIACFSNDALANDIAVNPLYNLLQDMTIQQNIPDEKLYTVCSGEEAMQCIAEDFASDRDSVLTILNTTRPNLVFIFLESWSADNVSILGGIPGNTPGFDSLCSRGLLFTRAYANAYVSDQGIPAVLSGFPSASRMAVINQTNKIHALPCLSESLLPLNYHSSFLFGGDLMYGNLKAYLLEKKFSTLLEQKDLKQYPQGRLGVHDEYTFPELLRALDQQHSPFMQCYFTTSTHMPYDYEKRDRWQSPEGDPEKKYSESIHYSDACMADFFRSASSRPWYKNTLFIVVADHSHNTIQQWNPSTPMHSHIPLLFTGGALREEWKGKQWNKIVSQLDIPKTLLSQMQVPSDSYHWSRNIFQPDIPSSAFYVFFGGSGYLNEQGYAASYLQNPQQISSDLTDSLLKNHHLKKARCFQQLVFETVRSF